MATVATSMTTEELLALPENGVERWLIAGELQEQPMPVRNRFHSRVMTCVATELENWRRRQPEPRGQVLTGDTGIRLQRDPDTTVGADLAYVSAEVLAQQSQESTIVDGLPLLVVEILSPSDTWEHVNTKIDVYLAAGIPLVWIIDPHWRTVTVHSPGVEPVLFTSRQELTAEPHLPEFRVLVQQLFA